MFKGKFRLNSAVSCFHSNFMGYPVLNSLSKWIKSLPQRVDFLDAQFDLRYNYNNNHAQSLNVESCPHCANAEASNFVNPDSVARTVKQKL